MANIIKSALPTHLKPNAGSDDQVFERRHGKTRSHMGQSVKGDLVYHGRCFSHGEPPPASPEEQMGQSCLPLAPSMAVTEHSQVAAVKTGPCSYVSSLQLLGECRGLCDGDSQSPGDLSSLIASFRLPFPSLQHQTLQL
ncbi:hypothetical protein NM208_g7973 [Fusarium decemcellulare]|uniref:Uncharacterized protein n=1 Tax=Fusarium decemcellulare TaxID=57161 RepID=A0ACC1S762_9HYPO|nr:hypothetical protein NM208_g7973 [Fusarium decemcellulare]